MTDIPLPASGDHVLSALSNAFTSQGDDLPLTLLVGGTWITGVPCSPRAWYTQVAHVADEAGNTGIATVFLMTGRQAYPSQDEIEAGVAGESADGSTANFIHLRDARSVGPTGVVPSEGGMLLKVRLESVDAWSLGVLGPPGYQPPPPAV